MLFSISNATTKHLNSFKMQNKWNAIIVDLSSELPYSDKLILQLIEVTLISSYSALLNRKSVLFYALLLVLILTLRSLKVSRIHEQVLVDLIVRIRLGILLQVFLAIWLVFENDLLEDKQTMFSSIYIHCITKFSLN